MPWPDSPCAWASDLLPPRAALAGLTACTTTYALRDAGRSSRRRPAAAHRAPDRHPQRRGGLRCGAPDDCRRPRDREGHTHDSPSRAVAAYASHLLLDWLADRSDAAARDSGALAVLVDAGSSRAGMSFGRPNGGTCSSSPRCCATSRAVVQEVVILGTVAGRGVASTCKSPGRTSGRDGRPRPSAAVSGHGRYFGSPKPVVQHVEDRQADVEADEVGERERSHRVVHPELHHRVDRLRRADAFHHREDRLVDHRHQDPVGDEAGIVRGLDRRLSRARRTARTPSASTRLTWPARESARPASSAARDS